MTEPLITEVKLEELAEQFYEDTGVVAPFKDSLSDDHKNYPISNNLWSAWCRGRIRGLEAIKP